MKAHIALLLLQESTRWHKRINKSETVALMSNVVKYSETRRNEGGTVSTKEVQ